MGKLILATVRNIAAIIVLLLMFSVVSSPFEQMMLSLLGLIYLAVLDNGLLAMLRSQSGALRLYEIASRIATDAKMRDEIQSEAQGYVAGFEKANRVHLANSIGVIILGIICLIGILGAVLT